MIPSVIFPEAVRPPAPEPYPPTLPVEVALKTGTIPEICDAYGITRDEWNVLRNRPDFRKEVADWVEKLKEEGMTFKAKARLQSEELLKTAWGMIHDKTGLVPSTVRADLIKFIIRASGLDESAKAGAGAGGVNQTALQININL